MEATPEALSFASLGETAQLVTTVYDQSGQVMVDAAVVWESADASVAAVDQNGRVTAVGNGATSLTATTGTATAMVAVSVQQVPNRIVLSEPPDSLAVGDSIRMTAEALDGLGNPIASVTFEWSSSDTAVATVDREGWVRAWAPGTAQVVVGAAGTTASAVAEIAAVQVPNRIVLSEPPDSLAVGDSIRMTAEALDGLGNPIASVTFEWSSSDTAIATVDQEGWVRARAPGTAQVVVAAGPTAGAVAEIATVQVPNRIVLAEPPESLAVGDSILMTAEALDGLYNPITNVTFEWSSSDTAIATVDQEGWVRARAAGSVEVTVTLSELIASRSLVIYQDRSPEERAALEAFYYATNGPEWRNNTNWLSDNPVGQWYGVQTDVTGAVVSLVFFWNGLTGRLPAELAQLTNLRRLFLSGEGEQGRSLTGPIPPELGELSKLNTLILQQNPLTGEIPPALADLTNLVSLSLNGTRLTGPIPPGLGRLVNLESLTLVGNLTGQIPPELANLAHLESLTLVGNLTGEIPRQLANLANLWGLTIRSNGLTGQVPPELGKLANLEHLDLGSGLTGIIPRELGRLSQLRQLFLTGNTLTGPIPPELGGLHNLETLVLRENHLTGPIPPELGALSKLTALHLQGNPLTGATIPRELGRLTKLESLVLHRTQLSGPIPPELGNLASLESLWLGNPCPLHSQPSDTCNPYEMPALTGPIPRELGNLGQLQDLYIKSHSLTGPVPPELGKLANLSQLWLETGSGTNGSIPPELGNLKRLESLTLFDTGLTGSVPPEIGNLANLQTLQLVASHVSGAIPDELGGLTKLRQLNINSNELEGRIPDAFLNLDLELFTWHHNANLCLPDTPVFQAWREQIRSTLGPYCAPSLASDAHGLLQVEPILVEPRTPVSPHGSF